MLNERRSGPKTTCQQIAKKKRPTCNQQGHRVLGCGLNPMADGKLKPTWTSIPILTHLPDPPPKKKTEKKKCLFPLVGFLLFFRPSKKKQEQHPVRSHQVPWHRIRNESTRIRPEKWAFCPFSPQIPRHRIRIASKPGSNHRPLLALGEVPRSRLPLLVHQRHLRDVGPRIERGVESMSERDSSRVEAQGDAFWTLSGSYGRTPLYIVSLRAIFPKWVQTRLMFGPLDVLPTKWGEHPSGRVLKWGNPNMATASFLTQRRKGYPQTKDRRTSGYVS